MGMKKTYYIEFGDGNTWWGFKEIESDMRYSNALQDGNPIEDETHGLISALGIYDKSLVTVREAGDDPGFSGESKKTLAVMYVRVWAEEEEEEEPEEEEEGPQVGDYEWYEMQGMRFVALRMDWPEIMISNAGARGLEQCPDDRYPQFKDGPTEDALERVAREMWKGYAFHVFYRDDGACAIIVKRAPDGAQVCHTGFKTHIEACLDALEAGKKRGLTV